MSDDDSRNTAASPFVCPKCGGGFPVPTRARKKKAVSLLQIKKVEGYACPWCGKLMDTTARPVEDSAPKKKGAGETIRGP